jgi:competence protein ComFC
MNIIIKTINLINTFKYIKKFSFCLYCNMYIFGSYLCHECWQKMEFWNNNLCAICGERVLKECYNCNFNIKTIFVYNSILKFLILKFKYGNKFFIGEFFINLLLMNIIININNKNLYIILYVPHYWHKQITSSINSSMFLAYELHKKIPNSKIYHDIFIKNSPLRQKDSKNYKDRFNITNKYSVNLDKIHLLTNQNVILIDDILTTGTTILTISKFIKKSYPNSLLVLTVGKIFY